MTGVERIAAERARQINAEGWGSAHDDEHTDGELALVAALYATPFPLFERTDRSDGGVVFQDPWPTSWDPTWDKRPRHRDDPDGRLASNPPRKLRIRALEKAGALIAAEIDRLLR